jgi:uncharacterized protein (TIGR03437 family)
VSVSPLFKHILLLLTAGLLVATRGQATALTVDNSNIPLTGSIHSQNVLVTSTSGSALNFDIGTITYQQPNLPKWVSATVAGCPTGMSCPTPATVSFSLTNDLGQFGGGPFQATVTLTPQGSGMSTLLTVTFYPGLEGIPGAITVSPSPSDPIYTVPIAYATGQQTVPIQQVVVTGTPSYVVSASTLSGGNWVLVSAGGPSGQQIQSTPASQILNISLNLPAAATLATALYEGYVVVTGADGVSEATINIALSVNGGINAVVTANPSQLTFAYSTSASPVVIPPQTIVVSAPVGAAFTATTDSPAWIILPAAAGGTIPGSVQVGISPPPTPKPPAVYNGHVTITVGAVTQVIAVQLAVSATPVLWASVPNSGGTVLFTSEGSVSTPLSQAVSLIASDGSSPALSVTSSPSWASASLNGNTLTITPTVSGAAPAVLSDVVVITAAGIVNSPVSIPVVLVENGGVITGPLVLNPSSLSFNALAGGAIPGPQQLNITAPATTAFNTSVSTTNGVPWLQVAPAFGATNQTLTVTVDSSLLVASATPYTGIISFFVVNSGRTQTVPVTLTVSPATGGNVKTDTNSLSLTAQVGTQEQIGTITVSNATGGTAPVLFNVTTSASAPWLSAGPAQATTESAVTITADPSGLAVNTYQGQVTISPAGGSPVTVNVTFTVQALPVISAARTSFTFTYLSGGEVPAAQTVQISGGAFTAAVINGGDWLAVSPASGSAATNLTMSVIPSGQSIGSHAGVIVVTGANNIVIITVTLNVTAPLPTVTSVLNGASFLPGAIAGGEVISVFGTQLGPVNAATAQIDAAGNLATTLAGTQLLVNGVAAPLIYVSSTQVTAVVPYGIAMTQAATVQVTYLNQRSNVPSVGVTNTSPAIFTLNSGGTGPGARNADFSPNGPDNPVAKGGYVVFFMTGEGPLDPAGVTGKINPSKGTGVAVAALPVGVLIDNLAANWTYAGGIPGVVEGILQLNVQIPQNAPSGELPVLVTIGGNGSQAGVTVSVK